MGRGSEIRRCGMGKRRGPIDRARFKLEEREFPTVDDVRSRSADWTIRWILCSRFGIVEETKRWAVNGKIAIIVVWKGVMACRLGMAPSFSLWDTRSEHKLGRKARVSRSRNGVELSCIKISILDWFSDIRAWIYDIILRALKLEQLGMSLRTILAWDFIENIAESQFWFSFRYSIPIGHRERAASL